MCRFGPIALINETSRPCAEELLKLIPDGEFAVCDFSIKDIERKEKCSWGYREERLFNVDHHADDPRFERPVSSGNLAIQFVQEFGTIAQVVINHTDCDSIISAGIVSGLLEPKPDYEEAVIAADHSGAANDIADLLQAIQDERDIAFSLQCLQLLESGKSLPERAQNLLDKRLKSRSIAHDLVKFNAVINRRLACLFTSEKIESELVAPFVKGAWVIAIAFKKSSHPELTELKVRLTTEAPAGLTLFKIGIKDVDPGFGGRWNAGSNNRGGASRDSHSLLFERIAEKVNAFEDSWILEKATQISAEMNNDH